MLSASPRRAALRHSPAFLRQLLSPTPPQHSPFQPNLTSLSNQHNREEAVQTFGRGGRERGIARVSRLSMRSIAVLHETPHLIVAGRNYCNGFGNNQYLLINKANRHGIFVDAGDDWPDDWASFLSASAVTPTHIFLTHCHVDNIINLNALMHIVERHLGVRVGLMWCAAEQPWVDAFARACERYGRVAEAATALPMQQHSAYSFYTYANQLHQRQRLLEAGQGDPPQQQQQSSSKGAETSATRPLPPQLFRREDILLSCATNRSTSFYEFGPHSTLHYLFTPGHSPGHMMLSLPRERLLFTGDVLYYNAVGRVDLPWAVGERLAESLLALEDFPDHTVLLPGHGRMTTMGRERRHNRALRALYERRAIGQQEVSIGFNEGYL